MPRAYLSSTFKDLEKHRQAALKAILAAGYDCSAMEHYAAADERPLDVCLADVARCELYVGLFAHRYGFIPPGQECSITELEFRTARQAGKPALLFFLDEDHPWSPRFLDSGAAREKVVALRAELTATHTVAFFTTPEDLAAKVSAALSARARADAAPAPAAGSRALLPPCNVPPFSDTPFIGRTRELDEVVRLFADSGARLVTVTGTGGIGKTRFACETARQLLDRFEDRCFFADLSEQQTITGVSTAVAEALGRRLEQAGEPNRVVADMLASLPPLLAVLDNFEQVVEHASLTVALWRRKAPEVRFLVTSRKLLEVDGQYHYRLNPLAAPAADDGTPECVAALAANEAIRLFLDRAARRRPGFTLNAANARDLVALCHKLECHPLSLVLVAERVKDFPPHQLLERLEQRFTLVKSGQRTLWKTLDWSYQLLKPHEQQAFVQACIFRDGFSLEAAEAVLRPAALPPDVMVMDVVQSLCDHSLLNSGELHDEARFGMFTTIQEFGQRQWGDGTLAPARPPTDLARRWADYYLDYSQRWDEAIPTPRSREALDRLVAERENVLAAHRWALEGDEPLLAARLILVYARTLEQRGPWNLRLGRLTESLERLGDREPVLRVRLLIELSKASWGVGNYPEAYQQARVAAEEAERAGDDPVRARALLAQGHAANDLGNRDEALRCYEASSALYRSVGDHGGVALNQLGIGNINDRLGRYVEALAVLTEAGQTFARLENRMDLSNAANVKGLALWHEGRPQEALACFEEAERISRDLGDLRRVGGRLTNRGLALTELDRFAEALACFSEAEQIHVSQGNRAWAAVNQVGRGRALLLSGDAEAARTCLSQALHVAEETSYRENVAFAAGCLGETLLALERPSEARAALQLAVAIQRDMDKAGNRRYWSNLIHLARAELAAGDAAAAGSLIEEALRLAERLALKTNHALRGVREDWEELRQMRDRISAQASALTVCGMSLSATAAAALEQALGQLSAHPVYPYPWSALEGGISLVGYGSLLNPASAARTLTPTPEPLRPVVAFGVRRLFEYNMGERALGRYGESPNPLARAALNVRITRAASDAANALLFPIPASDIEALRGREIGYDLVPVVCLPWERFEEPPFVAYILACPPGSPYVSDQALPHPFYYQLCRDGAASVSASFLNGYLASTFLGDGHTPLTLWEREAQAPGSNC